MNDTPDEKRFRFPKSHRLLSKADFDRVYGVRVARHAGPLRVHGAPNELSHCRLGLSVSRRVGNAVTRNRVKRALREAFRLLQHELPASYDWIIVVRKHDPLELTDYQRLLAEAARRIDRHWQKKQARDDNTSND